jgi:hypothetical protein
MSKSKSQNKRQWAVLEDLFSGELAEREVLDKHHVNPRLFERWLEDERFAAQFEQRIACAQRQSRVTLARYAPKAAAKLVQLTGSENQETARKACLDIIALHAAPGGDAAADTAPASEPTRAVVHLAPETARRLLAALAQGEPEANRPSV